MWNALRRRPDPAARPRVLFLNRSYRPDAEATGQLVTELTEDLADEDWGGERDQPGPDRPAAGWRVAVICGRPNANPDGLPAKPGTTVWRGVTVHRVRHTRLAGDAKRSLVLRAVDFATFLAAALRTGLFVARPDVVVAETDPFPLAPIGRLLAWRHRAKFVIHAQDVHPELGVALGLLKDGPAVRLVRRLMHAAARRADAVIVLSTDMRATFRSIGAPAERIAVLPNWADADAVRPVRVGNPFRLEHGLGEPGSAAAKFVVMHSGNMGRTQRLGDLLAAADLLRGEPDILFLLVGGGATEAALKAEARRRDLGNVRFLPYQPKAKLGESLSAADLQLVCTDARVIPYLMPSKLYGVLAAGVPVLAVAPAGSEMAATVTGELPGVEPAAACGWACEPGDVESLAAAILAASRLTARARMNLGAAGRALAERRFSRAAVTPRFSATLRAVLAGAPPAEASEPTAAPAAAPDPGEAETLPPARRAA